MAEFKFTEEQEAWLKTLESDEMQDKQTRGRLVNCEGKMCCLGVYCSLQSDCMMVTKNTPVSIVNWKGNSLSTKLNDELSHRLGLYTTDGGLINNVYDGDVAYYALIDLNDVAGWSFKKIASYIRANPRNVFKKGAD